jgi:hypothetical protein
MAGAARTGREAPPGQQKISRDTGQLSVAPELAQGARTCARKLAGVTGG